jgi:unsaturated chondroitin disaccharide hydrolase
MKRWKWFVRPTGELHHDVGFQFLSTAVIKHKITGDVDARRRGLEAANFLAGRYNPSGKFIRAWNKDKYGWAIINCMLNISLLFWASEVTSDRRPSIQKYCQ